MKRIKIKPQRKGRKAPKGRRSLFVNTSFGANKAYFRTALNRMFPNSTKVGAGEVTARRRLSQLVLHKRNHRSEEIIGNNRPTKKA